MEIALSRLPNNSTRLDGSLCVVSCSLARFIDTTGIETVRRDNCELVRSVMTEVLERLLLKKDVPGAISCVRADGHSLCLRSVGRFTPFAFSVPLFLPCPCGRCCWCWCRCWCAPTQLWRLLLPLLLAVGADAAVVSFSGRATRYCSSLVFRHT